MVAQGSAAGREALGKARTTVGQLNGTLEKLQLEGVDSVTVGELESGQAEARAARKSLNVRIEKLAARLEAMSEHLKVTLERCPP